MTKKRGFTLAEVLITLGIIGVVAAMTIPTLMNQTGQAEFKTGFKKAVSVLSQAITMNVALDNSDFSILTSNTTDTGSVYDMFTKRINVVGTGANTTIGGSFDDAANYTLNFSDGMVITFPKAAGICTRTSHANCIIAVDVNGNKRPNTPSVATSANTTAGVFDQFTLDFYDQQVLPHNDAARYILYN